MMEDPVTSGNEAAWDIEAQIIEHLKAGAKKMAITEELVSQGMTRPAAIQLVDQAHTHYLKKLEQEQFNEQFHLAIILPALVGGILSALLAGIIWGAVAIATDREFRILAVGVGLLCGYGVVLFARGRRGPLIQGVAVFSSMLGILVGKYIVLFHFIQLDIIQEHGIEAARQFPIWSPRVIQLFIHNVNDMLTVYDCVFFFFAMFFAWRIPSESDLVG
jgi:hypothetical protein